MRVKMYFKFTRGDGVSHEKYGLGNIVSKNIKDKQPYYFIKFQTNDDLLEIKETELISYPKLCERKYGSGRSGYVGGNNYRSK